MVASHTNAVLPVVRILVREIVPGDRRKFTATANDETTGGGARDLRFRPEAEFSTFFRHMFPATKTVVATRGGQPRNLEVRVGTISWRDNSDPSQAPIERTAQAEIWPPTDARPGECRLAKVHEYGFSPLLPNDPTQGKTVMMLIENADGRIWVCFTTENSIRQGNWHRSVKPFLLRWLEGGTGSGFLDLEHGEVYPE